MTESGFKPRRDNGIPRRDVTEACANSRRDVENTRRDVIEGFTN